MPTISGAYLGPPAQRAIDRPPVHGADNREQLTRPESIGHVEHQQKSVIIEQSSQYRYHRTPSGRLAVITYPSFGRLASRPGAAAGSGILGLEAFCSGS
jgi:hypothetical protein